jgi:hypothetical protein
MPDVFDKPGARPAASYALLYPHLVELVRPLGYALALHGSMNRDFDMVAVPWLAVVAMDGLRERPRQRAKLRSV